MRISEKCRNNSSDNPLTSRCTDGGKNMGDGGVVIVLYVIERSELKLIKYFDNLNHLEQLSIELTNIRNFHGCFFLANFNAKRGQIKLLILLF